MEKTSPVTLSVTALLLYKVSDCFSKYGKYIKWGASGLAASYGLTFWAKVIGRSCTAVQSEANPIVDDQSNGYLEAADPTNSGSINLKMFKTPQGYVTLPNFEDKASIDDYIAEHQKLSSKYTSENNHEAAKLHSTLLLLIYPDPMGFLETNSGNMPRETYREVRSCLTSVLKMMDNEIP